MSILEPRQVAEIVELDDDPAGYEFATRAAGGIRIVAEAHGESRSVALRESAGDFAKWLKRISPGVPVELQVPAERLVLRCGDYWLPLVFLAKDVALPVYLGLVSNYIYDKMKGALAGDRTRIRFSAIFEDRRAGVIKRFDFEGDSEALEKAIKRFDLNEFLDD